MGEFDKEVIGDKENIKKKCFIISPIGSDNSETRRHIEGIIDQAIAPAIGGKYVIEVAHRDYAIGSINDKVIRSIYESDLVIANLTELNPNVMFELAIRYSFGKPAIVIAEINTKLPFDITDERTIFYVNDPKGAFDLKELIIKYEANIDYNNQKYGPVYKSISKIPLYNAVESGEAVSDQNLVQYLIDRLDSLEKSINLNKSARYVKKTKNVEIDFDILAASGKSGFKPEFNALLRNFEESAMVVPKDNFSGLIICYSSDAELDTILKKIKLFLNKFDVEYQTRISGVIS